MYILYGILLMIITTQAHPLLSMHNLTKTTPNLSAEQNNLITAINLYAETPHRASFEKLEVCKKELGKLFNKKNYPHHYQHLKSQLIKTNFNKSIIIISTPNKNKQFNTEECVTEINRLSQIIKKLETNTSLPLYYREQISNCEPRCLEHLKNDTDFIEQTNNALLFLGELNLRFIPKYNFDTFQKSIQLKEYLSCFINTSDTTLQQIHACSVINVFTECKMIINNLYPHESPEKNDLMTLLTRAYHRYNQVKTNQLYK